MADEPVPWFEVRRVAAEEVPDLDSYVVGLAEHENGEGTALIFQVPLGPFDDQDRALKMDTYYISDAYGATVYGGLTRCMLRSDALILGFSAEAAETFAVPTDVVLPLRVDPKAVSILHEGLRRVFARASTPVPIITHL
jgi:hypothetical protein